VWKYILLGPLCLGACTPPTTTANAMPIPVARKMAIQIEGQASYYGGRHNGRPTSSGAIFNSSRMTAAHRTLPFGTKVIVTNLENSHTCYVEITDRGPALWTGRVIDVSEQAARCLEMIDSGVVPVRIEIEG
jgi:rare lipoprotein A